ASLAASDAHKEYVALMRWPGSIRELADAWVCDRTLHTDEDKPQQARTEFDLAEAFRGCALVRCRIHTGRYHQIRRHANHSGRHILGDTTHGKGRLNALFREKYGLPRLFLHLHRIAMDHPRTGARMELTDPLPDDLAPVLERLRYESRHGCPPSHS
ncbi:MAG: hypothetical protein KDC98_07965, partial [Planctomycetes bacterium]|nr:hypothetical protein [Planctomycetota bacterium]